MACVALRFLEGAGGSGDFLGRGLANMVYVCVASVL